MAGGFLPTKCPKCAKGAGCGRPARLARRRRVSGRASLRAGRSMRAGSPTAASRFRGSPQHLGKAAAASAARRPASASPRPGMSRGRRAPGPARCVAEGQRPLFAHFADFVGPNPRRTGRALSGLARPPSRLGRTARPPECVRRGSRPTGSALSKRGFPLPTAPFLKGASHADSPGVSAQGDAHGASPRRWIRDGVGVPARIASDRAVRGARRRGARRYGRRVGGEPLHHRSPAEPIAPSGPPRGRRPPSRAPPPLRAGAAAGGRKPRAESRIREPMPEIRRRAARPS